MGEPASSLTLPHTHGHQGPLPWGWTRMEPGRRRVRPQILILPPARLQYIWLRWRSIINTHITSRGKPTAHVTTLPWISLSEWSLTSISKAWTTQMCWHPGVTDHLGRWCPSADAEGGERELRLEEVGRRVKLHLDHLCHQVFKKKWWLRGGLLHTSSEECLTDTNFEKQPWGPSHPNRPLRHLDGL